MEEASGKEETASKEDGNGNERKKSKNDAVPDDSSSSVEPGNSGQGQKVSRWTLLARLNRLHLLASAASGVPFDRKLLEGVEDRKRKPLSNRKSVAMVGFDETEGYRIDMTGGAYGNGEHGKGDDDDDDDDEEEETTVSNDPYIKSAIPYLPRRVAVLCLVLNVIVPGTGTMLSGLCSLCCGHPRLKTKDGQQTETVCVNLLVGFTQMFTITFLLVGWIWSIVWGIYMVLLAVEENRRIRAKHKTELKVKTLTALNGQLRAWTLRQTTREN